MEVILVSLVDALHGAEVVLESSLPNVEAFDTTALVEEGSSSTSPSFLLVLEFSIPRSSVSGENDDEEEEKATLSPYSSRSVDNSFTYYLVGRVLHMMVVSFVMQFTGRTGFVSLKAIMEHLGSSSIVRGRGKNKRIWTYFEDEELIKALFEIALDPSWKSEGGFKNGYCQVLENVLAKKLPSSGLTVVPHIESRVRHFRTKFGAIEVMLTKSGFSWDDNRKMIQCEKQQYDDHCRKNNEAKGLYGVAFPHYDTLAAIYGKDIATGEGAEGLGEAVANMEKKIVQDIQDEEDEKDEERVSRETPRRTTPRRSIDSTASSSKKRKKDNNKLKNTLSSDPFMDVFANVQGDLRDVTKHVGAMVASMQREAEIQEKAMAEEDPLQKIQNEAILECQKLGLTGTEVVNAAAAFVKVPAQMSMLLALPESLRREYVLKILADEAKKN
ncbi:uncharacterized protein [Oryza sativa Japonica Group]|uniref:uncharacterized protein n=1 Tax=Oryza sativa subsp. japonica TaxID=39947 RepID=UPI0007754977|nr:uncharacterized protein LOC107277458 [Oryza sativa Japonica Group]